LNTSVQDAFNLGWKLSLVEKGYAPTTLLSTYSEERLPVIKRMIDETKAMYKIVMNGPRDKPRGAGEQDAAWRGRQDQLKQLGINYRWSSILVDEIHAVDAEEAKRETVDAYGALGGDGLHAGDRAPDAPALVDLKSGGAEPTSLFNIFAPTHHTVLLSAAMFP
ncbi:uncharacterized protein B0H18DRAFT_385348, partial [Fomitopsis serialis]|uniref:uncharacterized protein n=1 Tax=Fomitopsis serialis TaxID=139415 RepID=UPI0020071E20